MRPPSHEPNLRIVAALERAEAPALLAVALVSGGMLVLWNVPAIAAHAPAGWSQMPSVTALGVFLATISLALSASGRSRLALRVSAAVGLIVTAVPLFVLLTYTGLVHYHSLFWPVRPAPQTAVGFALAACSLPFIRRSTGPLAIVADIGAVSLLAFVLFLYGAFAFHVVEFVGVNGINLTSPQTLFCLSLLAFVIGSRRAVEGGVLAILVNTGIGSQIARTVLPVVLVTPFLVFMLISYLSELGLVTMLASRAVAAPMVALLTLGVLAWVGWHTNQLERQLRQQSLTDELTGVLNRRGFDTVAEYVVRNAERSGTRLLAFFFDLDGLKGINDDLGHEAGSLVIQRFSDLLVATFRKSDVVARVGGDEFVVLAPSPPDSAEEILARVARVVAASNATGLVPRPLSYSVGVAELPAGQNTQIADLVAAADAMMYADKLRKRAA